MKCKLLWLLFMIIFAVAISAAERDGYGSHYFDPDIVADLDIHGQLYKAILEDNEQLIQELKKKGADINVQAPWGETALMRNVGVGASFEVIKKLLNAGAKVGIKNEDTETVIDLIDVSLYKSYAEVLRDLFNEVLKKEERQEKIEKLRAECKVRRSKEMSALLFCKKYCEGGLKNLSIDIVKIIHQQLIARDEAEIMR